MRAESKAYTASYYEKNVDSAARASASHVIPFLVKHLSPKSLLELGAGNGIWSRAALEAGIADVLAVDGEWLKPETLHVPAENFMFHDLTEPFIVPRKFDLALCLEVGEHLPFSSADTLIDSLTRHTSVVAFGASMPFQGGTLHVNEQWPAYWKKKFEDRGYSTIDVIRPAFWNNPQVAYYYKQNTFLYCKIGETDELSSRLQALCRNMYQLSSDLVFIHPEKYAEMGGFDNVNVRLMLKKAPKLVTRAIIARMVRFFDAGSASY